MAESTIITGQFVRISQTPASIGERLMALIIDYFLIGLLHLVYYYTLLSKLSIPSGFSLFFFLCIVYLPILGYSFLCEMFNHGQSFGKLINIRVVKVDGSTPSIGSYLLRWIFSQLMVLSQAAWDFWSFY